MTPCNRCTWRPDRDLTCERHRQRIPARLQMIWHAIDKAHPLCIVCGQSLTEHEPQVCEQDLTATRADLALIVQLHTELPAHLGQPSGQSFGRRGGDEHALPGGTIMAMLGPGKHGGEARRLSPSDKARGVEGREHQADNLPSDPPSVAWSLLSWAKDWSRMLDTSTVYRDGEPVWTRSVAVPALAGYLEVNCRWAANRHPDFASFAAEMRSLRLQLEDVTGRTRKPTKAGASCFECGNALVRRVIPYTAEATVFRWWVPGAEGPLPLHLTEPTERTGEIEEDHATCSACREQYDPGRYAMALRAAAETASRIYVEGEFYSTPEALGRVLGRSVHTLTNWARRDRMCRYTLRAGVLFVHDGDATAAHEERKTRRTA